MFQDFSFAGDILTALGMVTLQPTFVHDFNLINYVMFLPKFLVLSMYIHTRLDSGSIHCFLCFVAAGSTHPICGGSDPG
jgi:hypothetical protein